MTMRSRLVLALACAAIGSAGSVARAVTVTETDSFQEGDGVNTFTPTYTAPANDILKGLAPTTITPAESNFDLESSGGTPVLTDGKFGPIFTGGSSPHPSFATGGGSGGTSLTYTLAAPVTLDSVVTLGGWNDGGRDTQAYTVSYEVAGNPGVFNTLATVNYDPTGAGNAAVQNATQVVLNGFSIPNVDALRFDFAAAENGHQGYAELAATGTSSAATPLPASAWGGLALLGGFGLTRLRRKARLV